MLLWLGTDSRGFFLLVESIIEIRWNAIFKKISCQWEDYSCKWTIDFLASGNHCFSIFQIFLPVTSFELVETDFLASGNHFLLFRGFSSQWKPSLKLVETNFKRTSIFYPIKTDFLAIGNHFLPFSQRAVSWCHWKQGILQLKLIFQPIFHSGQWKRVFCLLETVLFCSEIFSSSGNYY